MVQVLRFQATYINTTMDGFDVVDGGINEIAPYKRPLSNMAPTIVMYHGKPILTVGWPGR